MVSAQRKWQWRQCATGKCERCGRKRGKSGHYCDRCAEKRRNYMRLYMRSRRLQLPQEWE